MLQNGEGCLQGAWPRQRHVAAAAAGIELCGRPAVRTASLYSLINALNRMRSQGAETAARLEFAGALGASLANAAWRPEIGLRGRNGVRTQAYWQAVHAYSLPALPPSAQQRRQIAGRALADVVKPRNPASL